MSQAAQFWQYAEEAMLSARQSKSEIEKEGLMALARTWTQAAMQSEPLVARDASEARSKPGCAGWC